MLPSKLKMPISEKRINGFYFMPPSPGAWIGQTIPDQEFDGEILWTPLRKPVSETILSLMTSAGSNSKTDPDFDMQREKQVPTWG